MRTTLKELAASGDLASRGAAALIKAGYGTARRSRSSGRACVTRTLAEAFARELAQVHEQLGEVHESAFLETATGDSVEVLVDGLCPGGRGGGGSSGRGRVSAFVAEFDSAREIGALFDKIRPSSALGDDQEAVAAFNNVLDVWEFVTRYDKETVCRPVDLSELVKWNLEPRRA